MRCQRRMVLAILTFVFVFVARAAWSQELINLGTLPGLTPYQTQVGTAIDVVCPQLADMARKPGNLNSAQQDLLTQCTNMKTGRLGSGLDNALTNVTSLQTTSQGSAVSDTRTPQFASLGTRLTGLRLGTAGLKVADLNLDGGQKTASGYFGSEGSGGGASSDSGLGGRLGVFLNPLGSFGTQDATSRQAGFDFHNIGVLAGADYRILDNLFAGAAFSYLRTDASINAPALGSADSNAYGLTLYGVYYIGPLYFDLLGGFTYNTFDLTRQISYGPSAGGDPSLAVNSTATADTSGWQYSFNGGIGYDFTFGPFIATPYFRVDYINLNVDGYTESGAGGLNLKVKSQTIESLLTVLGGRISYNFSTSFGVLTPQFRAEWRHENLNVQPSLRAQFAADPTNTVFSIPTATPDRDYCALGASLSAALARNVSAFVDFETVLGLQNVSNYGFTGGIRMSF